MNTGFLILGLFVLYVTIGSAIYELIRERYTKNYQELLAYILIPFWILAPLYLAVGLIIQAGCFIGKLIKKLFSRG